MADDRVNVFFYGSYMNVDVLREVEIGKRAFQPASLRGYELIISPLANLRKKDRCTAYGILTQLTHTELDRLYQGHARTILGGTYLPEAVVVNRADGTIAAALCYLAHDMKAASADAAYVDRILKPAQAYGFPQWYLEHIASFR